MEVKVKAWFMEGVRDLRVVFLGIIYMMEYTAKCIME